MIAGVEQALRLDHFTQEYENSMLELFSVRSSGACNSSTTALRVRPVYIHIVAARKESDDSMHKAK